MKRKNHIKKLFKKYRKNNIALEFRNEDEFDKFIDILKFERLELFDGSKIQSKSADTFYHLLPTCYFEFGKKTRLNFEVKEAFPSYHYKIMRFSEFYLEYAFAQWKDVAESLGSSWQSVAECE